MEVSGGPEKDRFRGVVTVKTRIELKRGKREFGDHGLKVGLHRRERTTMLAMGVTRSVNEVLLTDNLTYSINLSHRKCLTF